MGRMLELLKNRDANRPTLADTKEPPKLAGAEVVNEWSLRDDDIPFIEVGRNQSVAGSPRVMAQSAVAAPAPRREAPQQPPVQPPHPPTEVALTASVLSANLLEPRPLSVNFEPYNAFGEVGKVANEIISYY